MNFTTPIPIVRGQSRKRAVYRPKPPSPRPEFIALIVALAWLLASVSSLPWMNLIAAGIGAFFGLRWFWRMLDSPRNLTHQLDVGSVALTTVLNLGYFISWLASTFGLAKDFEDTFGAIGVMSAEYAVAMFYAMLFTAAVGVLGRIPALRKAEERMADQLLQIRTMSIGAISILVCVCVVVDTIGFGSGILRFKAIATEGSSEGRVAWFLPFLQAVFAAQVFLNALLITQALAARRTSFLALGLGLFSTVAVVFVYFNVGRSPMVLAVALHFIYFCLFRGRRPTTRLLVPLAIVLMIVVPKALEINHFMRARTTTGGQKATGGDAFAAVAQGYGSLQDEGKAAKERKDSIENFSQRPLVATPLARCIKMDENVKEFMWGQNIIGSVAWALPRQLAPWKVRFAAMEGLLFRHFPDQTFRLDVADSLYLYSYADFGWSGLLLYPVMLATIWVSALCMISAMRRPLFAWILFSSWPPMFLLSIGEGTLIGWFIVLRNTIMFAVVLWAVGRFFPSATRRRA